MKMKIVLTKAVLFLTMNLLLAHVNHFKIEKLLRMANIVVLRVLRLMVLLYILVYMSMIHVILVLHMVIHRKLLMLMNVQIFKIHVAQFIFNMMIHFLIRKMRVVHQRLIQSNFGDESSQIITAKQQQILMFFFVSNIDDNRSIVYFKEFVCFLI
eukprot:UN00184